jgi:hypothetical protein
MTHVDRREFLKTVPASLAAAAGSDLVFQHADVERQDPTPRQTVLEPFDYTGVRLRPSRWQQQMRSGRDFYFSLRDEDILQGFRAAAGMRAPGRPLGGWCGENSSTVFGQWLSGMSRLSRATGDTALGDKALGLYTEWAKTVRANGDARMGHYPFDKLVCGLVDLGHYTGHAPALATLARVTAFARKTFDRAQAPLADPSHNQHYYGLPQEWYTLAENLYRAYRLTGDTAYRTFGDEWLYHAYWEKFARSAAPPDAHGVHAYSHVNTFSSAAMAYDVSGDPKYLHVIKNAYEYLQRTQCYATGGYGPNERFMAPGGALGKALDTRSDTCETVCGSWAGFKLSRYLQRFTGEAKYGDWIERLFYNAVGAALPIVDEGRNFYYGDYRVGGGLKVYAWDTFTCCSGTYIQNIADYHNIIYLKSADALYVNLFLPSEVTWQSPAGDVTLVQETSYPDGDATALTVTPARPMSFPLRFRVPSWTRAVTVKVNGADARVDAAPGTWATIARTWSRGDRVDIRIPLTMRLQPVDAQHPDRVAVMRGPVVFVLEGAYHDPNFRLPLRDEDLEGWLIPEAGTLPRGVWSTGLPKTQYPTSLRVEPPKGTTTAPVRLRMRPFYEIGENYPYFMYFDRRELPWRLW